MKDMRIDEFCNMHKACDEGREWAHNNCPTGMMSEAYEKLAKSKNEEEKGYFDWTWSRSFDQRTLRLIAVRMVRETPLADGRHVVDLLPDPRSLAAVDVAERYADGTATDSDLYAAWAATSDAAGAAARAAALDAAWAARDAAWAAALDTAWAAALDAAWAARDAAWEAARDAQLKIILSYGNPYAESECKA